MIASQSRKSARRTRQLSTGHGRVRSDTLLPSQIARQFAAFNAICRSFINRFIVSQLAASVRFQSHSSPAALKSP